MERKSFLQVVEYIKEFAGAHDQIKKVEFDFYEQIDTVLTQSEKYPAFFIVPLPSTFESNQEGANLNTFNLDVYCLDIIQKDRNNILEIVSDTALMLNDLLLFFNEGQDWSFEAEQIGNTEPINNSLLDYAAGNKMTLAVTVSGYSVCEIPMGETVPFVPVCEPATYKVEDQNGTEITAGEIAAGAYKLITIDVGVCEPATANLKTVGGTLLDSVVIPSGEAADVVAPNSNYSIKDTGGLELYSGQTESGATLNKTIQDATIKNTDNSVSIGLKAEEIKIAPDITVSLFNSLGSLINEATAPSLKDVSIDAPDITFTDSNGDASTVAAGVDITATACEAPNYKGTALPMKTGQDSVFIIGDDGATKYGRLISWYQLSKNNFFGNDRRFTGTTGGYHNGTAYKDVSGAASTYSAQFPNNIIIDWDTFDEETGNFVMYYNVIAGNQTWNNARLSAIALSLGAFTSGWHMSNWNEFFNVRKMGFANGDNMFNYPPFSGNSSTGIGAGTHSIWLANTSSASTAIRVYNYLYNAGELDPTAVGAKYFACRIGNISEL